MISTLRGLHPGKLRPLADTTKHRVRDDRAHRAGRPARLSRQNGARSRWARLVTKEKLFAGAGIVSAHLKLSERTVGLVGAPELALLGPDGLLVNTSRGPIVEEPALIDALRRRSIGGAALDVFDTEPLPADHPLRTTPNTVLTPHIGYVSRETYAVFYAGAVEDITGWLDGAPVRMLA